LRIAIVVHGRFHGFDLARELIRRGHDVTLFTNYPAFIAARFGIPPGSVRSFVTHGVLSRAAWKLFPGGLGGALERCANSAFGRWAAQQVRRQPWDVVHCFSGVAEETFVAIRDTPTARIVVRGSAHIAEQRQILSDEQVRAGVWTEKPSDWIVAREQREYESADAIVILGTFPERSFLDRGVDAGKLHRIHLGVNVRAFQASRTIVEERQRRIRGGQPLRVLNVGTFCLRKGALDFLTLIRATDRRRFQFRFVGPVSSDARRLWRDAKGLAEFVGKRPQDCLPAEYAWGDLFLLPTLEDGFAVVVTQALASALPAIVTSNCGAADLIEDGRNGWVVPIRRPDLLLERLRWCDEHREALADAVSAAHRTGVGWDWSQTACEVEQVFRRVIAGKAAGSAGGRNAV
jgi:glycosyltransferase involved in cell wall biosynthesis